MMKRIISFDFYFQANFSLYLQIVFHNSTLSMRTNNLKEMNELTLT